uniref:Lipase domain-containing protein n=1 Tax=Clastoptera arizonana TaxID=38151 RepID=A0A1B6D7K8_9HEMI
MLKRIKVMFNATNAFLIQTMLFFANNTSYNETEVLTAKPDVKTNTLYQLQKGEDIGVRCYPDFGCYSINFPWTDKSRPVSHFPDSPEKIKPKFCLYTRKNRKNCQQLIHSDPQSLYMSNLVATNWVYFIVHGFLEGGDRPWMQRLTSELLIRSDANVIVIDWGNGSSPPYTQAVANIRLVGKVTAMLIKSMSLHVGIKPEFCHIIGHSLGAQMGGYVGNELKLEHNLTLGRITGLDPAMPHFRNTAPIVRLDPTDAIFVDVIHSDTTPFVQGGLGMKEPVGHLDFYPNGGEDQPGCNESIIKYIHLEKGSFYKGVKKMLGCDHLRSHEYFIESINTRCNFLAVECDTWENFVQGNCFSCQSNQPNGTVCAHIGLTSVQSVHTSLLQDWQKTERTHVKLFTITGSGHPYCRALYRVTTVISNSTASIEHGGEIGIFSIQVLGVDGRTEAINIYREQHFKPGSIHKQVIAGSSVGYITSAVIHWKHRTTFNFLTWRLKPATLYLKYVHIDSLEEGQTIYLHPVEEIIISGNAVKLQSPTRA